MGSQKSNVFIQMVRRMRSISDLLPLPQAHGGVAVFEIAVMNCLIRVNKNIFTSLIRLTVGYPNISICY
jgi:hypothetical protein